MTTGPRAKKVLSELTRAWSRSPEFEYQFEFEFTHQVEFDFVSISGNGAGEFEQWIQLHERSGAVVSVLSS